jgi:2-polyprenyl-6-methoxyphenol hydroxylase-like FAD-dependent oxidoreductase
MGLNTGLLDADAVAETLIMIINEHRPLSLMDVYSDERRKVFQSLVDPMSSQNKTRLQHNTPESARKDDWYFRTLQNLSPETAHELARPFAELWRTDMRKLVKDLP